MVERVGFQKINMVYKRIAQNIILCYTVNQKISYQKGSIQMEKLSKEAEAILTERFGLDRVIALATTADGMPFVRNVNAFYDNGAFYVLTYGLSNKMQQIKANPVVAIAGDWFTAQGKGIDLGYFGKDENKEIASKMRMIFSGWIDNGHNNFDDENTCILRIELTKGRLLSHGKCYDIDFTK